MDVANAERLVTEGQTALETGHFNQARELFEHAFDLEPRPDLCQAIAAVSFEQGDLEGARRWLRKAIELDPDSVQAYEGLAKIHFELGHLRKALEYLDEVLLRHPEDVSSLYSAALIHLELGEPSAGVRQAERLLQLQPGNGEYLTLLGRLYRQGRDYNAAADALRQALDAQPGNPEANVQLGWCELELGNDAEARMCFEQALNMAPRSVLAWRGLAKIHLRARDYEAAVPAIRRVTEIEPNDTSAVLDLAEAFMESGRREQAMTLVSELLERAPEAPGVASRAGIYHFRGRDFEKAEVLLQQALVVDSYDADALETLGCTYLCQRDYRQALRCFRRVWRMRPLAPSALFNIITGYAMWAWDLMRNGRMPSVKIAGYQVMGGRSRSSRWLELGHEAFNNMEYRRASMYYRKVRVADPNYEVACAWLAHSQLKQGNNEAAIETCQRGLSRAPASAPLMALLGTLALGQDKRVHAVRILKKSLELDPELGDAWMTLGRAHQKEGDFQEALSAYQRAVELHVEDTYLYRHMGDTALAMDDRASAVIHYKRALEVNPRDLVTCQRLIECNFGARQYEDAIQAAKHAISVDPNAYSAYAWLGRIYRQLQAYGAAREAFEKAISIRPGLGFLHRQLGSLFEAMKLDFEAIEAYTAALKLDSDDWEADRGLARAKKVAGKR